MPHCSEDGYAWLFLCVQDPSILNDVLDGLDDMSMLRKEPILRLLVVSLSSTASVSLQETLSGPKGHVSVTTVISIRLRSLSMLTA